MKTEVKDHFNSSTNECTIILHKTRLKHFKTLRHVSILSDHHQGALFLAKILLRYSHSILICKRGVVAAYHVVVGMCCGAVARCVLYAE